MGLAPRALNNADRQLAEDRLQGALKALGALPPDAGPEMANAFAAEMRAFLVEELDLAGQTDGASFRVQSLIGRMLAYVVMSSEGLTRAEALTLFGHARIALSHASTTEAVDLLLHHGAIVFDGSLALGARLLQSILEPRLPRRSRDELQRIAADTDLHPQKRAWASMQLGSMQDDAGKAHLRFVAAHATDDQMRAEAALQVGCGVEYDRTEQLRLAAACALYEQTKAVALVALGTYEDGDVQDHFRQALQLGVDPQTRAKASLELGHLNDGDRLQRFTYALEVARQPDTKARALLGMALMFADEYRAGYLNPALSLAEGPATRMLIHLLLAKLGDGDVGEHRRQARIYAASTPKLQKLLQLKDVYRAFPEIHSLITLP